MLQGAGEGAGEEDRQGRRGEAAQDPRVGEADVVGDHRCGAFGVGDGVQIGVSGRGSAGGAPPYRAGLRPVCDRGGAPPAGVQFLGAMLPIRGIWPSAVRDHDRVGGIRAGDFEPAA